jgi:hypothetical protein
MIPQQSPKHAARSSEPELECENDSIELYGAPMFSRTGKLAEFGAAQPKWESQDSFAGPLLSY